MIKALMLHRVVPKWSATDYYCQRDTAVDFDFFRRMLDNIDRYGWQTVTSLQMGGKARRVCITFDDGYADNAAAFDELLARGMTATVFPVKNFIQTGFSVIDDMAAWLMNTPNSSPELIESLHSGRMKKILRKISDDRYRYLRKNWFGLNDYPNSAKFLTEKQLINYHQSGLAIGIHGVTHRTWNNLSKSQVRSEIEGAFHWLRNLGVRRISNACFPHGKYRNCKNLLHPIGIREIFGVDIDYADIDVTRRVWIKQNTDLKKLFA